MQKNDSVVQVRIPETLKLAIQAAAVRESRSLSNQIRLTLAREFSDAGKLRA